MQTKTCTINEFLWILSISCAAIIFTAGCVFFDQKVNPEPEKPLGENEVTKPEDFGYGRCNIITIKDGRGNTHEYIDYWHGDARGGGSRCHYPDCKYCLEKNNDKH
jgi:hypothetical protein